MAKWDLSVEAFASMDDFDAYQYHAAQTAVFPKKVALEYTALGLASESGEYAGKIKKKIRDGVFDDLAAADELGDCLWYLAMAAEALGYSLSEIADRNLKKLQSRQERGKLSGSGDNR